MTATLTFSLPEEQEEFEQHFNGPKLFAALNEFDNFLRSRLKYDTNKEWDFATIESVRKCLWETLKDNGCEKF